MNKEEVQSLLVNELEFSKNDTISSIQISCPQYTIGIKVYIL